MDGNLTMQLHTKTERRRRGAGQAGQALRAAGGERQLDGERDNDNSRKVILAKQDLNHKT